MSTDFLTIHIGIQVHTLSLKYSKYGNLGLFPTLKVKLSVIDEFEVNSLRIYEGFDENKPHSRTGVLSISFELTVAITTQQIISEIIDLFFDIFKQKILLNH